jgi:hypothetical protein
MGNWVMDRSWLGVTICVPVLVAFSGCGSLQDASEPKPAPEPATATVRPTSLPSHIRDNCASLLYDLLGDEKNLSKLLIIKRESDELHQLVTRISETSGRGAKQLEQLAQADRTLHLKAPGLPSGEAATREAIAETKKKLLLQSKGGEFEFQLLLTQAEALSYGAHLAKVAAQSEPRSESAQVFSNLQLELGKLYEQVCARLRREGNPATFNSKGKQS